MLWDYLDSFFSERDTYVVLKGIPTQIGTYFYMSVLFNSFKRVVSFVSLDGA